MATARTGLTPANQAKKPLPMAHTTNKGPKQQSATAGAIKSAGERPPFFSGSLLIGFTVLANPFVKVSSQNIRPVPGRGSRDLLDQLAKLKLKKTSWGSEADLS